ncbi:EAL domain-containing protein [Herbaspirillum sp. HC18]|nr:EAL domain-containing protein [Herbaspirillum sp. HC18]
MKILLLDDESFALDLLEHQLSNLGFPQIIRCESAMDALAVLAADDGTIDLIFCDLQMPRMDGVEFVRQLVRTSYAGGLVLVSGEEERILQTAHKLTQAHGLNVLGVLNKPVAPEQLRQLMENPAARSFAAPPATWKTYGPDELQRAITHGGLVNHYQPKVELATGNLAGVETLVRWRHPWDGLIPPARFIDTAEEYGFIDDLTRVVLVTALQDARIWQDSGLSLHLAVNVSMDSLSGLGFPNFVERSAAEAGVPLTRLVLEVTESRLMKNPRAALDVVTRLRLKRIGLSIDDFGTGHSSLAQLHELPFDELKVDQGFVHGACRDASLRAIVEASLAMARQLGMKTVAEGVEDRDDWDFLRKSGCDLAQGYFIAQPMPAAELAAWARAWEERRRSLLNAG